MVASEITLGAFRLSRSLVDKIDSFEPLPFSEGLAIPERIEGRTVVSDGGLYIAADGPPNPASPKVGDTRITFKVARPTDVSIVAAQAGDSFAPYQADAGGTIELLRVGPHSAEEMIEEAQASNRAKRWLIRLVGFVIMFIGFALAFRPLSVLADLSRSSGVSWGPGRPSWRWFWRGLCRW